MSNYSIVKDFVTSVIGLLDISQTLVSFETTQIKFLSDCCNRKPGICDHVRGVITCSTWIGKMEIIVISAEL